MDTLYIECRMGASGDMIMAGLLELIDKPEAFIYQMNALQLPGVTFSSKKTKKLGIEGTKITLAINGKTEHAEQKSKKGSTFTHSHSRSMKEIETIIETLNIPKPVKNDALQVYQLIAKAESMVHGEPVSMVHFHEVGMLDAIADVVGVCLLMHQIKPEKVHVSPIHVGSGQVLTAHGWLPVPAPATALLLKNIPSYSASIESELCTPTGAALLRYYADEFGPQPLMRVARIGYGMGTKDFEQVNCVRVFLGKAQQTAPQDPIIKLSCNIDDMSAEDLAYAQDILFEEGALDVYFVPIQMKKNRPATLVCCLCKPQEEEKFAKLILQHTSSFGVRVSSHPRYQLERSIKKISTSKGTLHLKKGWGYGIEKVSFEQDDIMRLAKKHKTSAHAMREAIKEEIWRQKKGTD